MILLQNHSFKQLNNKNMKKNFKHKIKNQWWALLLLIFTEYQLLGQTNQLYQTITDNNNIACITKEQYADLKKRVQLNVELLKSKGILNAISNRILTVTQRFAWPLTYNSNFYD